jgi:hypothetical protein
MELLYVNGFIPGYPDRQVGPAPVAGLVQLPENA